MAVQPIHCCAGPQAAVQWLFDNEGRDDLPLGQLPAPSFTSRPAEPRRPPQVIIMTQCSLLLSPTRRSVAGSVKADESNAVMLR